MSEFAELEEQDAVRMVWNVWPYSRLEAAKCVIPFGVIYTPAKQTSQLQVRLIAYLCVPVYPLYLMFVGNSLLWCSIGVFDGVYEA